MVYIHITSKEVDCKNISDCNAFQLQEFMDECVCRCLWVGIFLLLYYYWSIADFGSVVVYFISRNLDCKRTRMVFDHNCSLIGWWWWCCCWQTFYRFASCTSNSTNSMSLSLLERKILIQTFCVLFEIMTECFSITSHKLVCFSSHFFLSLVCGHH